MEHRLTAANSTQAAGLTPAAFRAVRYADWIDGTVCRLPQAASMRPLPDSMRLRCAARASSRLPVARAYLVVDTNNSAVYAPAPAQRRPLYEPWQAEVLTAVRMLRRWQYRDTPALPAPVAGMPPHCNCHTCATNGESRKAWQAANRQRIQREVAREAALQRTARARRRHAERLRQRLSK